MTAAVPDRTAIAAMLFADEAQTVRSLALAARLSPAEAAETASLARRLVEAVRHGRRTRGGALTLANRVRSGGDEGADADIRCRFRLP